MSCQDLYDGVQDFGCHWFWEWQKRLTEAVKRKHTLVVVYKEGDKGVGRAGLHWPPRIPCNGARRSDPGLGVSQRGEVAWLMRCGIGFLEEDIVDYRRHLMYDIRLEIRELSLPQTYIRDDAWPYMACADILQTN